MYKTVKFVNTITRTRRHWLDCQDEHLHETWDAAIEFLIARERRNIEAVKLEVKRSEARLKALTQKKARGIRK